jgi:hypothetical protein
LFLLVLSFEMLMSGFRTTLVLGLAAGCVCAHAQEPVGRLTATDASVKGAVTLTSGGMRLMSGSSVAAGDSAASLRLTRGGELRICPHASLGITASASGTQLMLAMNTGAVEADYRLASGKDTILTPDFRILLIGPGDFHFTVGADARGNTCIRTLEKNSAALVIEEQMGDGVRQLGPKEQAVFHNGSIKEPESFAPADCGCPAPAAEVAEQPRPIPLLEDADLRPTAPDAHVMIDAPFVFSAEEEEPPPPPVAHLRLSTVPPQFQNIPFLAARAEARDFQAHALVAGQDLQLELQQERTTGSGW